MSNRNLHRRDFVLSSALAGLVGAAPSVFAQAAAYPSKQAKIICGFAPGGGTDVLGRMAAQELSQKLGQPFVVENRTGAGGNIATLAVTNASPDGYTLLVTTVGQLVVSPHTDVSLKFNPLTDLRHITMLAEGDLILVVHADVPARNIQEFMSLAKKNPGKYNYGTAGAGSNLHLFTEYFMMIAGLDVQPVHYRGGAALTPDLLNGQVQVSLNGIYSFENYIKAGKLRPLLVMGKNREPKIPDVPTAREIGMPELEVCTNWFGLHAPAKTPTPIINQLNTVLVDYLKTDAVRDKLANMGMRQMGDTPEGFNARIAQDYKTFGEVAKKAKIQLN